MDDKKINEELKPIINNLRSLYDEIELMVENGIITREQADDMTGVTNDKMEDEKTKKKSVNN